MKFYLSALQSWARPRGVLIFFVAFLSIYALLNFTALPFSIPALQAAAGGKTILNVLPHYDAGEAYAHIAAYSPEAVAIYYRILLIDIVALIPVYVLFLTTGLLHAGGRVFRGRAPGLLRLMALMPSAAALLNVVEDGMIVFLIESYPQRFEALATLCGFITTTKSLLIMGSLLGVAGLYMTVAWSRAAFSMGLRKCHI